MIEYTYLVGSAQPKQADNQDGRSPITTIMWENIRIPSQNTYNTHPHKQAHNNTTIYKQTQKITNYRSHLIPQHKNPNKV